MDYVRAEDELQSISMLFIPQVFFFLKPQLKFFLQWETADAEMKVQSGENVLPLEPGVGQYIAIQATLTARDFFLTNFYPYGPFTCFFFQNLSRVFPVSAVANTSSCVGQQNKIGHPAGCRFLC